MAKFTKAQRIFNREHMNRPLGEYQKNMIDGVLKKYGKYTVKRPIDKTDDPLPEFTSETRTGDI